MTGTERALPGLSVHDRRKQSAIRLEIASSHDSLLEGTGFEPVWGFSCQAVIFGLLSVLCSERESRSSFRRCDHVRGARRKGSRDRNGSKAWRLAA